MSKAGGGLGAARQGGLVAPFSLLKRPEPCLDWIQIRLHWISRNSIRHIEGSHLFPMEPRPAIHILKRNRIAAGYCAETCALHFRHLRTEFEFEFKLRFISGTVAFSGELAGPRAPQVLNLGPIWPSNGCP